MVVGRCKVLRVPWQPISNFGRMRRKYHIEFRDLIYFMEYQGKLPGTTLRIVESNYDGYDFTIYNDEFEFNNTDRPEIIRVSHLTLGGPLRMAIPNNGYTEFTSSGISGEFPTMVETTVVDYGPESNFCKLACVPYCVLERYGIYDYDDIVGLGQELIHDELIAGVRTINVENNRGEEVYEFTMFHPRFDSPMKRLYIDELNIHNGKRRARYQKPVRKLPLTNSRW